MISDMNLSCGAESYADISDEELCRWLRENSAGHYWPADAAASRIEELKAALLRLDEALTTAINALGEEYAD